MNLANLVYPNWMVDIVPNIIKSGYARTAVGFFLFYFIIVAAVMVAFIYNVYEYHLNIKPDCSCIDQTESTMLYIQSVYYGLALLLPVVSAIVGLSFLARMKQN